MQQSISISCENCRMIFRVENLTPLTTAKRTLHCSACGSKEVMVVELQSDDVWYNMAASFGLPQKVKSVDLIKQLFEIWDPTTDSNFKDFVKTVIEEITDNDHFVRE